MEQKDGNLTGRRRIAVWIDGVGRFTLDDDIGLWEMIHPKHILEYRDETVWERMDPTERQISESQGWKRVTPDELVQVLIKAGVVSCE